MTASQIKLELFRQIDVLPENIVVELKNVVQSFLQQRFKTIQLTDTDINGAEIQSLINNNAAFDFLKADGEDIYSDADLKEKY
jgi:phage terminase Nu1 subunit (DNA packaging protein)